MRIEGYAVLTSSIADGVTLFATDSEAEARQVFEQKLALFSNGKYRTATESDISSGYYEDTNNGVVIQLRDLADCYK